MGKIAFSAFTKPFTKESPEELGRLLLGLGFDAMEFCLRDGYQVEPADAVAKFPAFVKQMKGLGLDVIGVAAPLTESVFAGCQAAGIPFIRTLIVLDLKLGFDGAVAQEKKKLEPAVKLAEKYGVALGIQHHFGPFINSTMELRHFIEDYPPQAVGAIWDSAQSILAGEEAEQALSIIFDRLVMVNLKNVYYRRSNGYEAPTAQFERYFTSGRQGMASWPRILNYLVEHSYSGPITLTHEYSDEGRVVELLREDLDYARSLLVK